MVKTGVKKAVPKIKTLGRDIVVGLKDGLKEMFPSMAPVIENGFNAAITAVPEFISGIKSVVSTLGSLAAGFAPLIPQLVSFGSGMTTTIQQVVGACVPALTSIISTVQTMLPVILPVIQTVVSTIGNIIGQAAPVIAGLVQGIGTVVSALAPVFSTIFSEIGEKVGSVISFVSERMGFIQEVIGTVAPLIGDIISTAWGVISPVIDIVISVFEILFGVVQKVFPGIQSIIETVWGIVKPLVEGIGSVIGKIAGWFGSVADAITGSGGDSGTVGENAEGDNNWKGGLTWVGEKGAELVDLPRGSRILPHKESVSLTKQGTKAVVRVIISDMKINLAMLIDDFTYSMREGDGDIYYTISFSEYRTLNVPSVQITTKVRNNGLLSRPAPAAAGGSYTVVGGDTLWGISKQKYGNGSSYPKIYNANNGTIEASAKKHGKSSSDNGHWIYPGDVYTIPA